MVDGLIPQIGALVAILAIPMVSKKVEHNIEYFFLITGIVVVTATNMWSFYLVKGALLHPIAVGGDLRMPIGITQVVLLAGLGVYYARHKITGLVNRMDSPYMLALLTFTLGIVSSVISAIVASVLLGELLALSKLPRAMKVRIAVSAAFAIGIGAALFPLGEPLSAMAIAKLSGPPYNAGFTFLFDNLWDILIPLVALFAIIIYFYGKRMKRKSKEDAYVTDYTPSRREVIMRTIKIYAFIVGLYMLAEFFKPLAAPVAELGIAVLYFFGLVSAAADNATLTVALVSGSMELSELRAFLTSLVIAGGLLIPGNVPNIIFASILKIGFKEWAKVAVPIGMPVFLAVAVIMLTIGI